jgi:hypothetical protein
MASRIILYATPSALGLLPHLMVALFKPLFKRPPAPPAGLRLALQLFLILQPDPATAPHTGTACSLAAECARLQRASGNVNVACRSLQATCCARRLTTSNTD